MLIDEYKALSARNDFFLDAEQEKAINKFQELYNKIIGLKGSSNSCLLYTSPSPRDWSLSRMPSSA